jgi:hypothetical protein
MEDKKLRKPTSAFSINRAYHSVTEFETLALEESDQDGFHFHFEDGINVIIKTSNTNCLVPNCRFYVKLTRKKASSEEEEGVKDSVYYIQKCKEHRTQHNCTRTIDYEKYTAHDIANARKVELEPGLYMDLPHFKSLVICLFIIICFAVLVTSECGNQFNRHKFTNIRNELRKLCNVSDSDISLFLF